MFYKYRFSRFLTLDNMGTPLKIKISKIGLRSDLSWPELGLEPKFHDPGTLVALENSDRHTDRQDSCFISIDIMVDLYSCINPIINYLNGVYIFSTIREVHKTLWRQLWVHQMIMTTWLFSNNWIVNGFGQSKMAKMRILPFEPLFFHAEFGQSAVVPISATYSITSLLPSKSSDTICK